MKRLLHLAIAVCLLTVPTLLFAEGTGTKSDPIIIVAGEPVQGPHEGGNDFTNLDYTYYRYVADDDGVAYLNINLQTFGSIMGRIVVNNEEIPLRRKFVVKKDDVVNIYMSTQYNCTDKTFTLVREAFSAGNTRDLAIQLSTGNNNVKMIKDGDLPVWYFVDVAAHTKLTVSNTSAYFPSLDIYAGNKVIKYPDEDGNYKAEYNNNSSKAERVYICMTANISDARLKIAFSDAAAELEPIKLLGALAYSIGEGSNNQNVSSITVTFPNHIGGESYDDVTLQATIVETDEEGEQIEGTMPLNYNKSTYKGTLSSGVVIDNVTFADAKRYKLTVSSVSIREDGINEHGAPAYTYVVPSMKEGVLENAVLNFSINVSSDIHTAFADRWNAAMPAYDITGRPATKAQKGQIIIKNGKKIAK